MSQGRTALQDELGSTPAPPLAALDEAQLTQLAATIAEARDRQAAALGQAMEQGLEFVPRVLRGTVRKVLFG